MRRKKMFDEKINEKYFKKMKRIIKKYTVLTDHNGNYWVEDNETFHLSMDKLLYTMLKDIGYYDIAQTYKKAQDKFWYS